MILRDMRWALCRWLYRIMFWAARQADAADQGADAKAVARRAWRERMRQQMARLMARDPRRAQLLLILALASLGFALGPRQAPAPLIRWADSAYMDRFDWMERCDRVFPGPGFRVCVHGYPVEAWPWAQTPAHYRRGTRLVALPVLLPDSLVTPGAIATADTHVVCHRSTKAVRHTTERTKARVYAAYGITHHRAGQFEIDHLIPLELGGADTITNLWPQPAAPKPGFHEKDLIENRLHALACAGAIPLDSAQRWIARDWADAFGRLIGSWPK